MTKEIPTPNWSFDSISLSEQCQNIIKSLKFSSPTPVQTATIPLFLKHKDVVVEAITGSGKTLAFVIPLIEILLGLKTELEKCQVGVVVISPTRELASQIFSCIKTFTNNTWITQSLLIGGRDLSGDLSSIREEGCNVIVSTPGRLHEILQNHKSAFDLKTLEVLILDEADRLLDLGFERTLNAIINHLPKQRRTGLFSATMSSALGELVRTGLRNPVRITVQVDGMQKTPEKLSSFYQICAYKDRLGFVFDYIAKSEHTKTIVYFSTCASVDYFTIIATKLFAPNIPKLFSLHGKMNPKKRLSVYEAYLTSDNAVLFCTDVAARGLDFSDVQLVVQYEAPQDPTTFVHRSGRTARNGRSGEAILMLTNEEAAYVDFLKNRNIPITQSTIKPKPTDYFEQIRKINSSDRDFYQKSSKAFVAFIRFYQEHQAKFIFNLKELDVVSVAKSFGLLILPRMKELAPLSIDFKPAPVDINKLRFKDNNRNKQREESFKRMKSTPKPKSISYSQSNIEDQFKVAHKKSQEFSKSSVNKLNLEELDDDWNAYKQALKKNKNK